MILKYVLQIIKHKWFLLLIGRKFRMSWWQIIVHDMSKFSPKELPYYAKKFIGKCCSDDEWAKCWAHHIEHNPHHWEHWLSHEMPKKYVREMMADWMAAGRSYEGKWPDIHNWTWLIKNCGNINVDWSTRYLMARILNEQGVEWFNAQWEVGMIN